MTITTTSTVAVSASAMPRRKQPAFDELQLNILHDVIIGACTLSMLGCIYILVHHVRLRRYLTPTLTQNMVAILSLLDLAFVVPKVFGRPRDPLVCHLQGFVLSIFSVMSVIWNACMAHSIYRKVVSRESEARLQQRLRTYLIVTTVPAVIAAIAEFVGDLFGDAIFYCWIHDRKWQFICFYLWVVLSIVYVTVVLLITQHHINSRARIQGNYEALESSAIITLRLRLYIIVFILMWLPSTIFRVFGNWIGVATFGMAIVMQLTLCSLGLITAIVYGGLLNRPLRLCRLKSRRNEVLSPPAFPSRTTNLQVLHGLRQPVGMFVTTFNMGEGRVSADELDKWIPRGHGLYIIGVQECLHLKELRQQILMHLQRPDDDSGSSSHRDRYAQFDREIGRTNTTLGYHGYIALTIYVRQSDVTSGAFFMAPTAQQEVHCGKALLFGQRAANKGAVGLGFRYFDKSFAVVSCHLASDLKGKSHLHRRNRDAADVLRSLHLNVDDMGFEFALMHHHTIVLGDLNYRLTRHGAHADDMLELMAIARRPHTSSSGRFSTTTSATSSRSRWMMTKPSWITSSLLTDHDSTTENNHQSHHSITIATPHETSEHDVEDGLVGPWSTVLRHDELIALMRAGRVFAGFEEARITFPPTFRRIRGTSLPLCPSSLDESIDDLRKYFTTAVCSGGERVPSYTDRILFYSQPDMRSQLKCSQYTCLEDVTCSDHKPVMALFHTVVNRDFRPLLSPDALEAQPRMQELEGVFECTLRIQCTSVQWSDHDEDETRPRPEMYNDVRVTIVFPLPSEDVFSEQRRLHELAALMRDGVFGPGDEGLRDNRATACYTQFVRDGMVHRTLARPIEAMHVALKIEVDGSTSMCFGQGVVGLPRWNLIDHDVLSSDRGGQQLPPSEFEMTLSVGGRQTGTLYGTVSLELGVAEHV